MRGWPIWKTSSTEAMAMMAPKEMIPAAQSYPRSVNAAASGSALPCAFHGTRPVITSVTTM
jgi:hypothetical protein